MAYDGTLKFDTAIDADGFQKGINSIGSIAQKGLKATTAILTGAATTIGTLGAAAIKVGSDFEGAMSKVEAISGATGGDLEALTNKAKEMGASTKFSATESANAFEYMAMAGWKTGDMLNGIEGIMNLAAASGEDLASTSDIVTDALTAFGMTASDSTHFADILAAASSNANTNVAMMGETFKYAAPLAGALGYSAEDTATAIGLMANAGIKGSQAGTSLRSMLTRLAKPTKESGTAMEMLGLSITDTFGQMKPLSTIIGDMREAFSGLTEEEQASYAAMLGGQEAMSGLLAIVNASDTDFQKLSRAVEYASVDIDGIGDAVEKSGIAWDKYSDKAWMANHSLEGLIGEIIYNLTEAGTSAEDLQEYLQFEYDLDAEDAVKAIEIVGRELENTRGAAERMAETMNDNLQGQITILKAGLEGLGISFYEKVQTPLKDIAVEAQEMVGQLQAAFNEGGLTGMVTAFGDVLAQIIERAAGAAPELIDVAAGLVSSFCDSIKSSTGIGEAAASLITSLVTALFSCADDIWTTAIILTGKMAQGIADGAPEIVQAVSGCVLDIFGCLTDWAPDFVDAGVKIIMAVSQGLADTLPVLIPLAVEGILDLLDTFVNNLDYIVDIGIQIIMAIADGIIRALPILIEKAPDIITNFWKALNRNRVKLLKAGVDLVLNLAEGIISAIPDLVRNLPKILEAFVQTVQSFNLLEVGKSMILSLVEGIKAAGSPLMEVVLNLVTSVEGFFLKLPEKIWNAIILAVGLVSEWGVQMQQTVSNAASSCIDSVVTWFSGLPNKIAYWLGYAIGTVIKWGINLKNTAETWVTNTINSVVNFFSTLPGKVWTWLVETVNRVVQWGINLKNTAETWVTNTINSVVNFFSQMPGRIWTWLVDTVNKVTQWGANLLSTASTAASNTVNKVVEWFSQLPGKVWTWLSNTLSKVTQFASDLKAKASSAAQGFVTNLVDGVKGLPDKFKEIGSNIVTGIWNGISSGWSWLTDKVKSLANSLFEAAKDALDINSPSKVFSDEVGRWIPPGIGVGMEKSMPELEKQIDDEMRALANRMQMAVAVETGGITVRTRAKAEHNADTEYPRGGGDTYVDQHIEQENNYHVPVATPSETSRAQREAARKLLGGVK